MYLRNVTVEQRATRRTETLSQADVLLTHPGCQSGGWAPARNELVQSWARGRCEPSTTLLGCHPEVRGAVMLTWAGISSARSPSTMRLSNRSLTARQSNWPLGRGVVRGVGDLDRVPQEKCWRAPRGCQGRLGWASSRGFGGLRARIDNGTTAFALSTAARRVAPTTVDSWRVRPLDEPLASSCTSSSHKRAGDQFCDHSS